MNRRQKVVLWFGAVAASLAILFPVVPGEMYWTGISLPDNNVLVLPRVAFIFSPVFKGKVPLAAPLPALAVIGVFTATAFATNQDKKP